MLNVIKIKLMQMKKSQRALAKKLRITETYLSEVICERKVASSKLRKRIARAIRADEAEVFPASARSSNAAAPLVISSEAASQ